MTPHRGMGLTQAQRDCACVMADLAEALGRWPTIAEIAAELDMSDGNAHRLLRCLVERGWVIPGDARRRYVLTREARTLNRYAIEARPIALTARGVAYVERMEASWQC